MFRDDDEDFIETNSAPFMGTPSSFPPMGDEMWQQPMYQGPFIQPMMQGPMMQAPMMQPNCPMSWQCPYQCHMGMHKKNRDLDEEDFFDDGDNFDDSRPVPNFQQPMQNFPHHMPPPRPFPMPYGKHFYHHHYHHHMFPHHPYYPWMYKRDFEE